jgi:hypothetical protein
LVDVIATFGFLAAESSKLATAIAFGAMMAVLATLGHAAAAFEASERLPHSHGSSLRARVPSRRAA